MNLCLEILDGIEEFVLGAVVTVDINTVSFNLSHLHGVLIIVTCGSRESELYEIDYNH